MADILYVSLGSTAGLRAADAELAASLRRAGASVVVATARPRRDVRTLVLTDLAWALAAWARARRDGEELIVCGMTPPTPARRVPGVSWAGRLEPADYRRLLRRARVYVTAPRREDYGLAQLEALADGAQLVTTAAPG